jgi:hypothetical protein
MKKFSAGGAQGKYERRMADIKKDFAKDSAGKSGRALEVLEAKRAQRIADAEDDRAKRMGTDRTATRKAEYDAEKNLSRTRKFGADKPVAKAEPVKTTAPAAAPAVETAKAKPSSFKEAFKDARSRLGAGKTFTFNGKSYTTNIAGEGRKASTSGGTGTGTTAAASAPTPAPEKKATPEKTIAPSKFDSKAFADLKSKVAAAKPVTNTGGTLARGKPGGAPLISGTNPRAFIKYGDAVRNDPARAARLAEMKRAAEAPGASKWRKDAYRDALSSDMYAKGGSVKKEKTMKYAKGGSTPPKPTAADRAADAKFRKSVKDIKVTPENAAAIGRANRSEKPGMAKGGKAKGKPFAATKFGAAMKKKSADTKGRAMMKFAKGGSIDGCAVKGKTKTSMVKMKNGGSC